MHNTQLLNEKWKLAFPSTQGKTVTFHQDHNPACFSRRPKSLCRLVSACQEWSSPKTQTITYYWSEDEPSLNRVNLFFQWISARQRDPAQIPTPSEGRTGGGYTSQGHCRFVLCWCLCILNWTLCNYRLCVILHYFKDGLLLTLLNTCTTIKKENISPRDQGFGSFWSVRL